MKRTRERSVLRTTHYRMEISLDELNSRRTEQFFNSMDELHRSMEDCGEDEMKCAQLLTEWLYRWCDSYERLPALLYIVATSGMERLWLRALGEHWSSMDNVGRFKEWLLFAFSDGGIDYESVIPELMSTVEQAAFRALPEQITIYRGCGAENAFGFSWSLKREVAARFPFTNRYHTTRPTLLTTTIPKSRAAALKLGREEHEIIVFDDPDNPSIRWNAEHLDPPPAVDNDLPVVTVIP